METDLIKIGILELWDYASRKNINYRINDTAQRLWEFFLFVKEPENRTDEDLELLAKFADLLYTLEMEIESGYVKGFYDYKEVEDEENEEIIPDETILGIYSDCIKVSFEIQDWLEETFPNQCLSEEDLPSIDIYSTYLSKPNTYTKPKAEKQSDFLETQLEKYGFFNLEMVNKLSGDSQKRLIKLISRNDLPYGIAMLDFLGFLQNLEYDYFQTKSKLYKEVSKWFYSDKQGRSVKGNISTLSPISKEDRTRYTAHIHKENVKKYYQELN